MHHLKPPAMLEVSWRMTPAAYAPYASPSRRGIREFQPSKGQDVQGTDVVDDRAGLPLRDLHLYKFSNYPTLGPR